MLIGRQEDTGHGGRIDLLAIAPDGAPVLIELKGGRTPREVVAQALEYASWVDQLRPEEIAAIYARFAPGRSLAADFKARFGHELDEETLNETHQIVIVAASLDPIIVSSLQTRSAPGGSTPCRKRGPSARSVSSGTRTRFASRRRRSGARRSSASRRDSWGT